MLNVILFVVTYISGIVLTFSSAPVFAFILYQSVYFFNPPNRWWGEVIPDLSYSMYSVLLMFIGLMLKYKEHSTNRLLGVPQFKWMYLLFLTFAISSFVAALPSYHSEALKNFLKLIIIISVAFKLIDSKKKLEMVLWGYIFGSWYISFFIYQVGRNSGDRVEGIGTVDASTSNAIAATIAPSLVLCLYNYWREDKWKYKIIFVIAGVFIANAIVLINSRGAFLAVSASLLYFMIHMYYSKMQKKFQKITVIWLAIMGLAGVAYIVDDSFEQRMTGITSIEKTAEKETAATRIIFWEAAWNMAKDHPIGTGSRGFEFYLPLYIPENVNTGASRNRAVHSTWFQALTEAGYLGLLFLIILISSCFKATKHCKYEARKQQDINAYFKIIAIEASLVSYLVSMTFINRMTAEILCWLILFTACAYNIYVVKNNNQPKSNF